MASLDPRHMITVKVKTFNLRGWVKWLYCTSFWYWSSNYSTSRPLSLSYHPVSAEFTRMLFLRGCPRINQTYSRDVKREKIVTTGMWSSLSLPHRHLVEAQPVRSDCGSLPPAPHSLPWRANQPCSPKFLHSPTFVRSSCCHHAKNKYIYLSDQTSACMKSSARSAPTLHSGKLYGCTSFDMSAGDTDDDDGKHTRPITMSSNDDIYTKLRPLTKYRFARIACPIVHTSAYSRQAQNSCKFGKSMLLNSGIKVHKISDSVLVLLDYLLRLHRRKKVSQHRLLTNTLF